MGEGDTENLVKKEVIFDCPAFLLVLIKPLV
jgi:hypothetical protein